MWLTVKETAKLLSITDRGVRFNCELGKYNCRYVDGIGHGGKQLEIELESLPDIALMRYYGVKTTKDIITSERPNGCSEKQWQEAERKSKYS